MRWMDRGSSNSCPNSIPHFSTTFSRTGSSQSSYSGINSGSSGIKVKVDRDELSPYADMLAAPDVAQQRKD